MTHPEPDVPDEYRDADLEIARIRDLLGQDLDDLPLEDRVLARTLNRIDAGASVDEPAIAPRYRRAMWLAAAAVAVAVMIVAVALWPRSSAVAAPPSLSYSLAVPEDVATAPSASQLLDELAAAAAATSLPGQGTVQYVGSFGWNTPVDDESRSATIRPFEQSWWLGSDGSAVLEQRFGAELRPDGTLDPTPSHPVPDHVHNEIPPGSIPDVSTALSRDPATLRSELLVDMPAQCAASDDLAAACLIEQIVAVTGSYVLPSDLAAAMWRMLADVPGVHTLGSATDRVGRDVVAIAAPPRENGLGVTVLVLLADPATGRVVGTETVTLESEILDVTTPMVTGFTTITDARLVSEVGADN